MPLAADEDGAPASPLTADEFARAMARFAPFEQAPRLAVAVSGGADSLALALLAGDWARARKGGVTALTVDHRLRPEAAAEAAQVGAWLGASGIAHATLVRTGPPPPGDIQAQARAARYRLLAGWCEANGVLHLLTAHHREDQAETLLLRLARGSGLDGLAGMAAQIELAPCRVLRPVLGVARARLAASLRQRGQDWIEDPSNRDRAYARTRLRQAAAVLAGEGLIPARLAATAAHLARARAALEPSVAALLARAAWLHPAGFAWLDPARLGAAAEELGLRALAGVIMTVGGAPFPPRLGAIERLYHALRQGGHAGSTLGGCRILARRGAVLVCREAAAVAPPIAAPPGESVAWDGRFRLILPLSAPPGLSLGALGPVAPEGARTALLPQPVRATLPALRDAAGVVAVPHLHYRREDGAGAALAPLGLGFRPARALTQGGFA